MNWQVRDRRLERVTMALTLHPQPGYPFLLDLRIDYSLGSDGLRVRTRARNVGERACPYAAGFHPYLRSGAAETIDGFELQHPAATWLPSDERAIPTGRAPVANTDLDFRTRRAIGTTALDTAFTDLARSSDGTAVVTLHDPSRGADTELWCDNAYEYLMLFTGDGLAPPARRRALAVEPMTAAPDAFNNGFGLTVLGPGAEHEATWGLRAT